MKRLIRLLSPHLTGRYLVFVAVRVVSFFIIGIETFFGPKIVGLANYGLIEYEKQLINLAAILLMGVHSGYGYYYFQGGKHNTRVFLSVGAIHVMFIYVLLSLLFRQDLISFGVIFYLFAILVEQLLKIENRFNMALLYKPLVSILLIGYYLFYYKFSTTIVGFRFDVNLLYLAAGLVFYFLAFYKHNKPFGLDFNIKGYWHYITKGFEPNLTSSLVLCLLFVDRYFIDKYYSENLGVYAIGYNFSYVSFLLASSISYVTTIKIGERLRASAQDMAAYIRHLKRIAYLFIVVAFITLPPVIILTYIYWFPLPYFYEVSFINLAAKTIFGAASIVSPIIFYKNKERLQWSFLLSLLLLLLISDYLVTQLAGNYGFVLLQLLGGAAFIIYGLYIFFLVNKILKQSI